MMLGKPGERLEARSPGGAHEALKQRGVVCRKIVPAAVVITPIGLRVTALAFGALPFGKPIVLHACCALESRLNIGRVVAWPELAQTLDRELTWPKLHRWMPLRHEVL